MAFKARSQEVLNALVENALRDIKPEKPRPTVPVECPDADDAPDMAWQDYVESRERQRRALALRFPGTARAQTSADGPKM